MQDEEFLEDYLRQVRKWICKKFCVVVTMNKGSMWKKEEENNDHTQRSHRRATQRV